MKILLLILIGAFAGVLSGMLGIGGGVVLVPALTLLLGIGIHQAIGISLAVIVPTACAGVLKHHLAGNVDWKMVLIVVAFSMVGAWFGATFATNLPAATLKKAFGAFLIIVGIDMLFGWTSGLAAVEAQSEAPEAVAVDE